MEAYRTSAIRRRRRRFPTRLKTKPVSYLTSRRSFVHRSPKAPPCDIMFNNIHQRTHACRRNQHRRWRSFNLTQTPANVSVPQKHTHTDTQVCSQLERPTLVCVCVCIYVFFLFLYFSLKFQQIAAHICSQTANGECAP